MQLDAELLTFFVFAGQNSFSTELWSYSVSDSATYFLVQNQDYNCNGGPYGSGAASMTLYEEVDYVSSTIQQVPRWDFEFLDTSAIVPGVGTVILPDTSYGEYISDSDGQFPTIPHTYVVDFTAGPDIVRIPNEAYGISFSSDTFTLAPGKGFTIKGDLFPIGASSPTDFCVTTTCSVSQSCGWPSTWSGYCSFDAAVPTGYVYGSALFNATVPISAAPGLYYAGAAIQLTSTSPNEYTNYIFYINVT